MTLKLYGHDTSPFVRRVRIVLAELALPFERDTHGWLDPVPEFLANAPIKRLPMLDRGAGAKVRYVYDSRVIASVLYEMPSAKPAAGVQPTLFSRALQELDQNLLSVLDGALDAGINLFLMERDGIKRAASPYLQRQAARLDECLDWANRVYEGKTLLTPGQLAFVDMSVVATVAWLRFRGMGDIARWPHLAAVEAALASRPSVAATQPG